MISIPTPTNPDTVTTQRRTLTGTRAGVRAARDRYVAAGTVLTYSEPYPDPDAPADRPGQVRVDLVLMVEPTAPPAYEVPAETALVPVRPIEHRRTVPRPPVARTVLQRTRRTWRRVRTVRRSTVVTVVKATAATAAAAALAAIVYEIVLAVNELLLWIAAHTADIIGGCVVVLLILALIGAVCPACGRR